MAMSLFKVPMPQMGESITEGTVSKWLRTVGHRINKDEPILEISTDKVDAEIPSPVAGVLVEICVEEGRTVEIGTVLAYVDTEGEAEEISSIEESSNQQSPQKMPTGFMGQKSLGESDQTAVIEKRNRRNSETERLKAKSSPVVQKIAKEHEISISNVPGTGHLERVTKTDILRYIKDADIHPGRRPSDRNNSPQIDTVTDSGNETSANGEIDIWDSFYNEVEHPSFPVGPGDDVFPMDKLRQITADHMVLAKRVVPHVHSVIEVDFSSVDQERRNISQKGNIQERGISFTAFVTWACSRLLTKYKNINAVLSGKNIIHRSRVNIGIAVDLNPGLIVPVIKDTDGLSLAEISLKINDLAGRARSGDLLPEEIAGSTFAITNPGVLGTVLGMPIIPKGTSAILVLGAIEKRPVVVENAEKNADEIVVRKTSFISLGFDHRIVDGADAARFLLDLKKILEAFPGDV
jgi:pyruvate dehydrogenase E2 component (dihydrolipoamide acetyltransferase)